MLVTVVVTTGVVLGTSGVVTGLLALRTARRTARECRLALARRAAAGHHVDSRAIRDVALYRYDALDEMSGRLSFSLALVNGFGDGVVLTSINGRTETRTYARAVRGGRGVQPLSPEEEHAVRAARLGVGPLVEDPVRR